jgi:S-adenosylmethionine decarboxylase
MANAAVSFIQDDKHQARGRHLIMDAFECVSDLILDEKAIEDLFVRATIAAGATVLFSHSHPFGDGASSGVVVLAESHASWHVWSKERYVAIDIFMCGDCDPSVSADIISHALKPLKRLVTLHHRGYSAIDSGLDQSDQGI